MSRFAPVLRHWGLRPEGKFSAFVRLKSAPTALLVGRR